MQTMPSLSPFEEKQRVKLVELLEILGKKPSRASTDIGFSSSYLGKIIAKERGVTDEVIQRFYNHFNVSKLWWESDTDKVFVDTKKYTPENNGVGQVQSNARIKPIITENEYTELPFVSIPARATFAEIGDGVNVDMHETFTVYKKPGEDFSDQIVIEIDGDSMEPYYVSGSKVRAKRVPADRWPYLTSGVYAVAAGGSFLIKRIKNNDFNTGTIVLHSDNEITGGSLTIKIQDIRSIWKVLRIVDSPAR